MACDFDVTVLEYNGISADPESEIIVSSGSEVFLLSYNLVKTMKPKLSEQ